MHKFVAKGLSSIKLRPFVECSPCREIHMISYPPRGKTSFVDGQTEASFELTGREKYVRVECIGQIRFSLIKHLNKQERHNSASKLPTGSLLALLINITN